jgi:hypothetical protein
MGPVIRSMEQLHGYTHVRGYHPLLAIAAVTGDVLMARLREGRANTARGAAHFLVETIGCGPAVAPEQRSVARRRRRIDPIGAAAGRRSPGEPCEWADSAVRRGGSVDRGLGKILADA